MRSARTASAACAATLPIAVLLTGCVSTQTTAARVRLTNARLVAATQPIVVLGANPEVSVETPVVIHGRAGTAIVISLRNDSSRAVTDLPISVGAITRSGRRVYLNRAASNDYFANHIAAIGPHATTSWVYVTSRRLGFGHPFAVAGVPTVRSSVAGVLPRIDAATRGMGEASGRVTVTVTNRSRIPQDDVPIYVVGVRGGREVAAGHASVAHLGAHATTTLSVSLLGQPGQAALTVIALPTIFS